MDWKNSVWLSALRRWSRRAPPPDGVPAPLDPPRLGLALGGGFARGIAHVGVLRVLERNHIPIHCIAGVSAGAIVASAYASGTPTDEIALAGSSMRFGDIARWSLGRMGFAASDRMGRFLQRLLKRYRFEEMIVPLGVVATDVITGDPVKFHTRGDVFLPVRASCSYPGLFRPVECEGHLLVDGAMSMEIPAALARDMGANCVIAVHLPLQTQVAPPSNMFQVVNRCFQIMQKRTEDGWRAHCDVVINPDVTGVQWDGFASAMQLIEAGEKAAEAALPAIQEALAMPGSIPALPSPTRAGSSAARASALESTVPAVVGILGRTRLSESPGSQG